MLKNFNYYSKSPKVAAAGAGLAAFTIGLLVFALSSERLRSSVSYESPEIGSEVAVDISPRSGFSDSRFIADMLSLAEVREFKFDRGDSVAGHLSRIGVNHAEIHEITGALKPIIKMSEIKSGGDRMLVKYRTLGEGRAEILSLDIIRSPIYRIRAKRTNSGFDVEEIRADISTSLARASGSIDKGASFIETANALGVPYNIVDKFYEIFSFDVDFVRDIRPDDRFAVMFEKLYSEDGTFLGAGDLLYAELYLNSRKATLTLYRYENGKGVVGYFDENGKSAAKTLKKTPINGARISSRYGWRRHPVLGFSKEHKGVDFAAPHGTPIPAGGSGTVVDKGYERNGYGNYVKIRHNSTYSTVYAHLSSFHRGVSVGTRINQGQFVGYVGSTGMSTGPHLHYEIHKNGVAVNPLTISLPSNIALPKEEEARFAEARDKLSLQFTALDRTFSPLASFMTK